MTIKRRGTVSMRPDSDRTELAAVRRLVVKIGSGVIAGDGALRPRVIADLAHDVTVLMHRGQQVVMVVSGAVASGYRALGMSTPPKVVLERQAAAAVGQPRMMAQFAKAFARHRLEVAQLLMLADDIEDRRRFLSARRTLHELLDRGVVPILNENDALSDHEAVIGDNDHLAALVTNVASAQLLVILSRVPGVLAGGSGGEVIPRIVADADLTEHITSETSTTGVGGMIAKASAARLASQWGVPTVIVAGSERNVLQRLLGGENIGTLFVPGTRRLSARKRWIAVRARSRGAIQVDDGALRAIGERHASLLPSGITDVRGDFAMGARVDVLDPRGRVFAVGLVCYSAAEIRRLRGRRKADIQKLLGYEYVPEVINRDELVVLEPGEAT